MNCARAARAAVFRDLARHDAFAPLVLGEKRVLAPGHGLDSGLFDRDYLAGAIDEAWNHYTGTDLRVTTNAGTFTGRVSGGRFAFTGPAAVSFDRPTTRDVLFCDGALAAPNDGTTGPVAAILGPLSTGRCCAAIRPSRSPIRLPSTSGRSPTTTPGRCTR